MMMDLFSTKAMRSWHIWAKSSMDFFEVSVSWVNLFAHEGVLVVSGSWSDMLKEHLEKGHWVHIILCCMLNYV